MKTHYTPNDKVNAQTVPACQGNPKPRWIKTNERIKVTCDRCKQIHRIV